ncbi:MAG: hypothetical protein QXY45_01495 [Candidatus Aenigmatarchaeota archaeon]
MSSRNWKEYNDQLVRRGEALLDFDFLKGWGVELEKMNEKKASRPYQYPQSFIKFLAFIYENLLKYFFIQLLIRVLRHSSIRVSQRTITVVNPGNSIMTNNRFG